MTNLDVNRIRAMGHREFVGGEGPLWDQIALLQLEFLKSEGLKQNDTLMDIACGALRAGRLFIQYLDEGKYLGLEKEVNLLIHGVAEELGITAFVEKKPEFIVSENFEFDKFSVQPNYAIAQSLFTHLTADDLYRCLRSLRKFTTGNIKFYATFFEVPSPVENYSRSDSLDCFFYTREQINTLADLAGWTMHYIGDWGHPRQQKMIKLEPK
ncbi:MAG TPA: hypothetical protein VLC91_16850 [Spongiibacteraceae bacterium]|nr:hypothetical protein [Spongiibacteraceae bacterium]